MENELVSSVRKAMYDTTNATAQVSGDSHEIKFGAVMNAMDSKADGNEKEIHVSCA
jgi:hypothetical protein